MKGVVAFVIGFFVLGAVSREWQGYLIGGIVGYLLLQLYELKKRIFNLERQLRNKSVDSSDVIQADVQSDILEATQDSVKEQNSDSDDTEAIIIAELIAENSQTTDLESLETNKENVIFAEKVVENPHIEELIPKGNIIQQNELVEDENSWVMDKVTKDENAVEHEEPISEILEKEESKPKSKPIILEPSLFEIAFKKVKSLVVSYFTGGNSLVRTGMLLLFIGVAFLLKYVAERTVVPIEYRYIGISLACLVMLVLGWRLRKKRPGFALSLQGGGIGLLYLTLFAALRLHDLIAPHVVLFLLIGIVCLSAMLAILQDSMALAVIGMIGGFAAPILTSTGHGSHVQLFSYYLLLNIGVFAISWFKSWRILNVIGFVATFGIGSLWGFKYYKPEFLLSVEPFLIAYFLLYTFIAVLFAIKQPPKLKGINDGTIIFGTPLVGFALQAGLMKDNEYGLAYSALVLGVFYVVFAYIIKLMKKPYMKDLIESFVALGIGFATLAIPLGFDGRVTSAMWTAEGSALLWVGVKQLRLLPRFSGYGLTLLGMGAYFIEPKLSIALMPWLNADYIGALIIFISTAFIALYVRKHHKKLFNIERNLMAPIMCVLSVFWWVYGGMFEIHHHYSHNRLVIAQLFLALSSLAFLYVSDKVKFELVKKLSIVVSLLMLVVIAPYMPVANLNDRMFLNVSFIGLLILSVYHLYLSWYWNLENKHKLVPSFSIMGSVYLITGLCSWLYVWSLEIIRYYPDSKFSLLELFFAVTTFLMLFAGNKLKFKLVLKFSIAVSFLMLVVIVPYMPEVNLNDRIFLNVSFIGLLILSIYHLYLSWYWSFESKHKLSPSFSNMGLVYLVTGLCSWLYVWSMEIIRYYPDSKFLLLELFFAISAFLMLFASSKLRLVTHKLASTVVTFMMILPITQIPKSSQSLLVMANIPFIGLTIYSLTHLAMSWYWQRNVKVNSRTNPIQISNILWMLGIASWVFTGHNEISTYVFAMSAVNLSLVFMSFSFVFWIILAHKLNWKNMHYLSYTFTPYLFLMAYYILTNKYKFHTNYGLFAWGLSIVVNYWILKLYDNNKMLFKRWYHLASLLLFSFIIVFEFGELIKYFFGGNTIWYHASPIVMTLFLAMGLFKIRNIKIWPFMTHPKSYFQHGLMILFFILWVLLVTVNLTPAGESTLISYLPIINILDISGIIFILFAWKVLSSHVLHLSHEVNKLALIALPITAFVFLNASMLRIFHYWYGIDYKFNAMISSFMVQSAFSILWSLTAVILMVLASKKKWRVVWLTGLGLIVAVVIKLFLVDMSASGTIARIVAFLSVGLLLSLVGYFSPLPPDIQKDKLNATVFEDQFNQEEE